MHEGNLFVQIFDDVFKDTIFFTGQFLAFKTTLALVLMD
jgi:hypothetical protein